MANKPLIMDHPLIQHKLTLLRDNGQKRAEIL